MNEQINYLYDFEPFRIDTLKRKLLCNGQDLQIKPKAFDTLLFSVERHGQVVSKDELMSAVWSDTAVEENNLTQQISASRKTFSEQAGQDHGFIITMPKQGYKFAHPVKEVFCENQENIQEVTGSQIISDSFKEESQDQTPIAKSLELLKILLHSQIREIILGRMLMVMVVFTSIYIEDHKQRLGAAPMQKSIAVMNFEALDRNEESNFYSTGTTHTLTAKIGNMESMVIRPVGSTGEFFGQERNAIAVGNKLSVDIVLDGTVQNDGEQIRVTVIAWDLKANRQLWGNVYTKEASDTFKSQDEISEEIISAIKTKLLN